jgi:hypothetical protein
MAEEIKLNVVYNTGKDGRVVAVGLEAPDGHVAAATPEQSHDPAFHASVREAFAKRNAGPVMPHHQE